MCAKAWLLLAEGWYDRPRGATKLRFLWALSLLKSYDSEENMASQCQCDEKTWRKWVWFFISELAHRVSEAVSKINEKKKH